MFELCVLELCLAVELSVAPELCLALELWALALSLELFGVTLVVLLVPEVVELTL